MGHLVIWGASGKLGQEIITIASDFGFEHCSGISRTGDLEKDILAVDSLPDHDWSKKTSVSGIIDVSSAHGLDGSSRLAKQLQVPLIVASTGHQYPLPVNGLDQTQAVLIAPNTSMAMLGLIQSAKIIASQYKNFPKVRFHIDETHRLEKLDSPSGTALLIQKEMELASSITADITSHRVKDAIATHHVEVVFPNEKLVLTHQANNRSVFAHGALLLMQWLIKQPAGFYNVLTAFNRISELSPQDK